MSSTGTNVHGSLSSDDREPQVENSLSQPRFHEDSTVVNIFSWIRTMVIQNFFHREDFSKWNLSTFCDIYDKLNWFFVGPGMGKHRIQILGFRSVPNFDVISEGHYELATL